MVGSGWKWVEVDGSGWEWVGVSGSGWEWVGMGGSGWEWMGVGGSGWEWVGARFSITDKNTFLICYFLVINIYFFFNLFLFQ